MGLDQVRAYFKRWRILSFLEDVHEAARRAARIVADMLSFSRRSQWECVPEHIEDMLDTVIRLADAHYDLTKKYDFRQIEIIRDYDPDLGEVCCDRTEIEQVLLNLIKNAAQAMSDAGTPPPQRIILRTRRESQYACVEVEDNGPGMDEDTRSRVFEPFFTCLS